MELFGLIASDSLLPARNQMAFSLGWHIILACFGMAFPMMIYVAHRKGLRGDDAALALARRWSKIASVLFAIGAVSGTILSFEMGLLWPTFMEYFGDVVGLAFALEGVSFFTEAIFLGIYVYGWDRLPPRVHILMLVPIIIAGITGSFLVLSVNAWMNAPTGFTLIQGPNGMEVTDVKPLAAIFNSAVWLQYIHMYLAGVTLVGFTMAATHSVGWLRGKRNRLHRLGILIPLTFASIAAVIQPFSGHLAGQMVARDQPMKLAAMEALATTTKRADMEFGGYWNGTELKGALQVPIPGLLSFVAKNNFNATIEGLDTVPPEDRPPAGIVHFSFDVMVAFGTLLMGLAAWVAWRWYRRRDDFFDSKWFLRAIVAASPAAILALEFGWVTTEVGRQPWIVYKVMRTEEAVTNAGYIWWTFGGLVVLYAAITWGAFLTLRTMGRRWDAGETNIPSPYGPAELTHREVKSITSANDDGANDDDAESEDPKSHDAKGDDPKSGDGGDRGGDKHDKDHRDRDPGERQPTRGGKR